MAPASKVPKLLLAKVGKKRCPLDLMVLGHRRISPPNQQHVFQPARRSLCHQRWAYRRAGSRSVVLPSKALLAHSAADNGQDAVAQAIQAAKCFYHLVLYTEK